MDEAAGPSRTAMLAALGRAVHLFHYGSRAILQDWLAWPLVGADVDDVFALGKALVGEAARRPFGTWFAARSRLSEDWLAQSGCTQHVLLGAGLDSSAWRSPHVRVFEVDHPATQGWKRARVASLELFDGPTWVPLDFEREELGPALTQAGLVESEGVFVSWQGVIPYLTVPAISATLEQLPPCTLAISYLPPATMWEGEARGLGEAMIAAAAGMGEPWITFTTPDELAAIVADAGFDVLDDLGPGDVEARYGLPAIGYERIALARRSSG